MRTSLDVRITVGGEVEEPDQLIILLIRTLAEAGYPAPVIVTLGER